jgi:hypothetical protein
MPLAEEPDLEGRWEYFYERTIGCVGVLKDWLTQAFQTSIENGEQTLKDEHIEFFQPPMSSCKKILDEILAKEGQIAEAEKQETSEQYRARLKLVPSSGNEQKKGRSKKSTQQEKDEPKPAAAQNKNAPPFQRAANRDPVGVEELVS